MTVEPENNQELASPICHRCGKPIRPGEQTHEDGREHWACIRPPAEPRDDADDLPAPFI